MHCSPVVIVVLLLCTSIFCTGCTQPDGTPVTGTPAVSPTTPVPLESLMLTPADVPLNFSLNISGERVPSDVGRLARELGWQEGFVVRYTTPATGSSDPTEIIHTVALYPAKNIPAIVALTEKQERSDNEMNVSSLPSPALGENSRAFSGKVVGNVIPNPTYGNPLVSGSVQPIVRQDYVEIIFSKGETLEVLRMTGPQADLTTLSGLARRAYDKIP